MQSEWTDEHNPMLEYYDADFPSRELGRYPENFDEVTEYQGLAHDVPRYLALAAESGGPILEPFCGTGRVAIPLARAGHDVTAVDLSRALLAQLDGNLARAAPEARPHLSAHQADARTLALPQSGFALAIIAFNSLACVPDLADQRAVLERVRAHLVPGGRLALDVVHAWRFAVEGEPVPVPFFTRRHPLTGRSYTRFAALGPFDARQRQRLFGHYDQLDDDGRVQRRAYATWWRPLHRFELELLLEQAGFAVESWHGGHRGEPWAASSPRHFVIARR